MMSFKRRIWLNVLVLVLLTSIKVYWFVETSSSIDLLNENANQGKNLFADKLKCNFVDNNIRRRFSSFLAIPLYYYKSGYLDITNATLSVTTFCSIRYLSSAQQIALNFNGPISISIYIESLHNEIQNKTACNKIISLFTGIKNKYDIYVSLLYPNYSSPYYQHYYKHINMSKSVHVLSPETTFPYNALRNLAVSLIKTKYVLVLDVDFIFMSKAINSINSLNSTNYFLSNDSPNKAWIIPSFEIRSNQLNSKCINEAKYLFNKAELLKLIEAKQIGPFHFLDFKPAQFCTLYSKWYHSNKNYEINYCNIYYEPYIIFQTKYAQNEHKWNDKFIGPHGDKVQQITKLAYDCFEFEVLNDMFIIHEYKPKNSHAIDSFGEQNIARFMTVIRKYCHNRSECWERQICRAFRSKRINRYQNEVDEYGNEITN